MIAYDIHNIQTIATPQLIYYTDLIAQNTALAVKTAGNPNRLRPHVKSHKTVEVAKIQAQHGISKFKTATIAETEMMLAAGFSDILLAYPLVGPNVSRFIRLRLTYPKARLIALTDHLEAANVIAQAAKKAGITIEAMLDIDAGLHRSGVSFERAQTIYPQMAALSGISLIGLHVYDGDNKERAFEKRFSLAKKNYEATLGLKSAFEKEGLIVSKITLGGTPSFPCYAQFPEVELSPGTCFLQDASYAAQYPDMPYIPAAILATRVVSKTGEGRITFDLGYKAIASDPPLEHRMQLIAPFRVTTVMQNEEHWVVRLLDEDVSKIPNIGDVFYVIPAHVCPTSALYEKIAAVSESRRIEHYFAVASRQRTITI